MWLRRPSKKLRDAIVATAAALALVSCSSAPPQEVPATTESQTGALTKYEGRLLRRQGNSPEESKIYLVRNGTKHWVMTPEWLDAHRSEYNSDVVIVTEQELESIPNGDPLK